MKVYLLTIILTSYIARTYERKSIGKLTNLSAVTNFEGIENFYHILRQEKAESPPQESKQLDKNISIKKTLCKNIFTSNHFVEIHREEWIDVDVKENRVELKSANPDLFKFIYRERRTLCLSFVSDTCYSYRYENNYRLLPISVNGFEDDDYFFMCLVREPQSRKIKPYFVSQAYNVNAFRDNYPMAGRFVFAYNTHKNGTRDRELKIVAMAEEAAVGWEFLGRFIEMYYVSERSTDKPRSSLRRKSIDRRIEVNKLQNGIGNRSLPQHDTNKTSIIGNNGENTDTITPMPSFSTGSELYADDLRDRTNRDDGNRTTPPWLGNEKKTLNNTSTVWNNDMDTENTPNTSKAFSTLLSRATRSDDIATMREMFQGNDDPICQLSPGDKLRLCAIILASSVFKGKVRFVPTVENVQLECERKAISLIAEVAAPPPLLARITQWELRESGRKTYEESMIGCRAITRDKNYKMTYLVSQGNYDNSIFLYTHKFSDRRVFVYNYFNNTSVI